MPLLFAEVPALVVASEISSSKAFSAVFVLLPNANYLLQCIGNSKVAGRPVKS